MSETGGDEVDAVGSAIKSLTRTVVTDYVLEHAPEKSDELTRLFDTLYGSSPIQDGGSRERRRDVGLQASFDDLLPAAIFATRDLVRSAVEAWAREQDADLGVALDRIEGDLMNATGDPLLVSQLRRYLDDHRSELVAAAGDAGRLDERRGAVGDSPPRGHAEETTGRGAAPAPARAGQAEPPDQPEETGARREPPADGADRRGQSVRRPDLLLLVERLGPPGGPFLRYQVISDSTERGTEVTAPCDSGALEVDPEQELRGIYAKIEGLHGTSSEETVARRLHGYARDLAKRVLPGPVVRELRNALGTGSSLQVVSEEPWIPWELLALDADEDSEEAFLGERFAVTRWRSRRHWRQAVRLPLETFALVMPSDSGLRRPGDEEAFIRSFERDGCSVQRVEAHPDSVRKAMLEGGFDVWHFAAHGSASSGRAADWRLRLEKGDDLVPADFDKVAFSNRPLVVLNACSLGRSERGLTGIAGLVEKLIDEGAGAVVGPLWGVDDDGAFHFVRAFYRELKRGTPLGESARRARSRMLRENPRDPTPLAYAVFGHPDATHDPGS